ncbi:hypothetical protein [Fervidibacillus albus]|uniref:Uncharacterized protein n=1 Tax=Fervidibacillus albus TaxID=2980026 RepID=A0A9E8RWL6_9BACI|nr:hypothetical protein [Fervidibacillus albus]WAA10816.1 hypothetical protein OE104_05755 [Fervidibacillus albus]
MRYAVYICRNSHEFAVDEKEDPAVCPICGQMEYEYSHNFEEPTTFPKPKQINLSIFLESDQERASREIDCYGYLLVHALGAVAKTEFSKAAIYHENIVRSLRELQHLKNEKRFYEFAADLLKRIEERQQEEKNSLR